MKNNNGLKQPKASMMRSFMLRIGAAVSVLIALISLISYWHVYKGLESQTLYQLKMYSIERGMRESQLFQNVEASHAFLRDEFKRRYSMIKSEDAARFFNRVFEPWEDGTIRARRQVFDGIQLERGMTSSGVTGFIGLNREVTDRSRMRLSVVFDLISAYGPSYRNTLKNLYIGMHNNMGLIYWPEVPWDLEIKSDYDMTRQVHFFIADKQHNPRRESVYTDVYYDEVAKEWMVSCITPIDDGAVHIASMGSDILINEIITRTINDHLENALTIIIGTDGELIAHSERMKAIERQPGLKLDQAGDGRLMKIFQAARQTGFGSAYLDITGDEYVAVTRIEGPDWYFMMCFPKSTLTARAFATSRVILLIGVASLFLGLLSVLYMLNQKVLRPLENFVAATAKIGVEGLEIEELKQLPVERKDEIGLLATSFQQMSRQLIQREAALKASDAKHRAMVANIADVIAVVDGQGVVKYASPNIRKWFGWSPADVMGKDVWTMVHADDLERLQIEFNSYIDVSEAMNTVEFRYQCKNGDYKWIELTAVNLKDDPAINGVLMNYRDISERKQTEAAILESEAKYRRLTDHSPDMIYRMALPDGTYEYVSKAATPIFGYPPQVWYANPRLIKDIIHPDWRTYFEDHWRRLQNGTVPLSYEYQIIHREGDTRWLHQRNVPIRDEQGKLVALEGIVTDITTRKQVEQALFREKERLLVTLRSIGDGVITTDTKGRVMLINKIAEKLTGWPQKQANGKSIEAVFHIVNSETGLKCENPVAKVLKDRAIVSLANHTQLIAKDGAERMIEDSGAPIFDSNNEIIGVVLVFRDVTEKHRTQKQLQQTQKMESIGILAGGIAHDFNNMLSVVIGNASHARTLIDETQPLFKPLADIQASAKRAQNLTQQLLIFAKGGAPIKTPTDLNQLIKETVELVGSGSNSNYQFDLAQDLWRAEVDKGQMNQVFSNLIINANQAMPDGGAIDIKTANIELQGDDGMALADGSYIHISVQDQGVGIPEKHLPKVFDPYFSTKQKGSGLGLAIAYSIIQRHDGCITVYSEIEKGSVFHIYLPASVEVLPMTEKAPSPSHQGGGRVLIMDDQALILDMLQMMLRQMEYETATATDGLQAIEMYRQAYEAGNPFDLVILDLTVPGGLGGAKTIPELLKIDPQVKAVVSSGYANDPIMANYQDYGFCGVVPKPYTKSDLASLLNSLFDKGSHKK